MTIRSVICSGGSGRSGNCCRLCRRAVGIGLLVLVFCFLPSFLHLFHTFAHLFCGGSPDSGRAQCLRGADLLFVFCVQFGDFCLRDETLIFDADLAPALVTVPKNEEDN
jgi:hypothetical protein